MRDPVVSPVALIPTVDTWLAEVNQLFADNKFGDTTEADFRTAFAGAAVVFADWRHLSVKRVKGATYPVPYLDNLGLVPADYRILGMQVEVINGVDSATGGTGVVKPPVFFTLQRNSAGDVDALLNTDPDTTLTVKARYVQTSGTDEQRIASYLGLPLEDTLLDAGDVYKYLFPSGETRLLEVRADINQFQNPVPTGLESDPYYKLYAPLTSANEHEQNTDVGTIAGEFRLRLNSSFQERGVEGATYLVFEGTQGGNQAAIRFRFQNSDDTEAAALEQCLAYTATGADTWKEIGGDSAAVTQLRNDLNAQVDKLNTLVTGAPPALDTLPKIAAQLASDESGVAAILATQQQHTQQIGSNTASIVTNTEVLTTHTANLANPHFVTKMQVGLGNADNTSDANKPVSAAASTALAGKEATGVAAAMDAALLLGLRDGVNGSADTLQKLYNLVQLRAVQYNVATLAARNALNVSIGAWVNVDDDGDGRWAIYRATSAGVNASYNKVSDPDLLNAAMSASQIKAAYESNADTNAFTNTLLTKLAGIAANATANSTDAQLLGAAASAAASASKAAGTITGLTTSLVSEDPTRLYYTEARALAAALAGYVKAAASRAITASDSVLVAIGLLEKKTDDNTASVAANTASLKKFETIVSFPAGSLVSPPDFYPTAVTLTPVTKSAGAATVEYSTNGGGAYTALTFVSGVCATAINISALTEVTWRITLQSGSNTASISIIATKP